MERGLLAEVKEARRLPPPAAAKGIRTRAGVSQARLAAELEVHRVTVARWESGLRQPRGALRAAYAALLLELQKEVGWE